MRGGEGGDGGGGGGAGGGAGEGGVCGGAQPSCAIHEISCEDESRKSVPLRPVYLPGYLPKFSCGSHVMPLHVPGCASTAAHAASNVSSLMRGPVQYPERYLSMCGPS